MQFGKNCGRFPRAISVANARSKVLYCPLAITLSLPLFIRLSLSLFHTRVHWIERSNVTWD